jgi:hypothetical protein
VPDASTSSTTQAFLPLLSKAWVRTIKEYCKHL